EIPTRALHDALPIASGRRQPRGARDRRHERERLNNAVDPAAPSEVAALVEHLFRHSAGHMVSSLARRLGSARLDLAEEAVQDARSEEHTSELQSPDQ